jgi:tRNA modification GTPase
VSVPARWRLVSPPGSAGAVAVFEITGEVDAALAALGVAPVAEGRAALRDLSGIDTGVVTRWSGACVHLMPHGGQAVVAALTEALRRLGPPLVERPTPDAFPEARTRLDAAVLAALARAQSPLAIDLLLAQPAAWAAAGLDPDADDAALPAGAFDAALDGRRWRLIDPPLVAAVGASNIGKSTLINRFAGRRVAVVADEPGTTRDYVGVRLDLGGLVVYFLDTPGLRPDADDAEREAVAIALSAARGADLVLACGDPATPPPPQARGLGPASLGVCLRSDLGHPAWAADTRVSARTGAGVEPLVARIRDTLLGPAALDPARPWRLTARA